MKEGHLSWNNIWMFTKGGQKRGQQKNFYKLMDLYLSPWFVIRLLDKYGFTPQMIGMKKYINDLENQNSELRELNNNPVCSTCIKFLTIFLIMGGIFFLTFALFGCIPFVPII